MTPEERKEVMLQKREEKKKLREEERQKRMEEERKTRLEQAKVNWSFTLQVAATIHSNQLAPVGIYSWFFATCLTLTIPILLKSTPQFGGIWMDLGQYTIGTIT